MIVVAGFNSAVDRLIDLRTLRPGEVQRADRSVARPGGKGVHVAQTIAALGMPVTLVGLCDDALAEWFERSLALRGVRFRSVRCSVSLRQCVAIREADGRITEILERGVDPGAEVRVMLDQALRREVAGSDALVCTGSLPPGFADDYYARLVRDSALPCLVDASGVALARAVERSPFLVKPNASEAAELAGYPVTGLADAVRVVRRLHAQGIRHPTITLGADGALGVEHGQVWHARLAVDGVRNAVGSGDCFLAGMTVALSRGDGMREALRLAVACGAANALGDETGFVTMDGVRGLLPRVVVHRLDD